MRSRAKSRHGSFFSCGPVARNPPQWRRTHGDKTAKCAERLRQRSRVRLAQVADECINEIRLKSESKPTARGRSRPLRDFTLNRHRVQGHALVRRCALPFEDAHGFQKCESWKTPTFSSKMRTLFRRCATFREHLRIKGNRQEHQSRSRPLRDFTRHRHRVQGRALAAPGPGSRPWYNGELVFLEPAMISRPEPSATRRDFLTGSALRQRV